MQLNVGRFHLQNIHQYRHSLLKHLHDCVKSHKNILSATGHWLISVRLSKFVIILFPNVWKILINID